VVGAVHGIEGVMSMVLAGQLEVWSGYEATFLTLAAIAALGAALFWPAMPETRDVTAENLIPAGGAWLLPSAANNSTRSPPAQRPAHLTK
jgi:hypothetical protein